MSRTVIKKYKRVFLNEWFSSLVFIEMRQLNMLGFCCSQIILLTDSSIGLFSELHIFELNFTNDQHSGVDYYMFVFVFRTHEAFVECY